MNTQLAQKTDFEIDLDALRKRAEECLIENNDQYLLAANQQITDKKNRAAAVDYFAEIKSSAYATWKGVVAKEKGITDVIDFCINLRDKKMKAFRAEQERIRLETQARLQAEADEKAAAEKARLLKNAKANERRGNTLNADMYREAAAAVEAPVIAVATTVPKASGISSRKVWMAELVSKSAFIAALAENPNLAQFVSVDVSTMVKQGWRQCPGVKFYEEEIISARA